MTTALAAALLAFIGGLMYRELVICSAASRDVVEPTSRSHLFVSGYFEIWSRAAVTRLFIKLLGVGAVIAFVFNSSTAGPWATAVSIAATLAVLLNNSCRTWPLADSLASATREPVEQRARLRTLRWRYAMQVLLVTLVLALQTRRTDEGSTAAVLAVIGSAFLAATMWNEVVVDAAVSRGEGELSPLDRSALLGYYRVMTLSGRTSNLSAVFLSIGVTVAALVVEVQGENVPLVLSSISLVLFCAFLVASSALSWQMATRVAKGGYRDSQLRAISGRLGRLHRHFVSILVIVTALQVVAAS
jgi:hypothetical protein